MSITIRTALAVGLVCALAGACQERPGNAPILEQAPAARHHEAERPAARADEPAPTAPLAAATLNDAQSVTVLGSLDHGEVELARYALERARSEQARSFAQMMIDQHTQAEADVVAWAQANGVAGQASDVTPTVESGASAMRTRLEYASDDAFDRAYVQGQIEMHSDALELLDQRIVPGAQDGAFRDLVTRIRSGVATHLAHARQTLAQLPAQGTGVATR